MDIAIWTNDGVDLHHWFWLVPNADDVMMALERDWYNADRTIYDLAMAGF